MFGKRPSELIPADILRVVSEGVREGSQMEFKEALPERGGRLAVDPWATNKTVSDHARNKLLEEVIGFANAYGGWLLVGVEETADKPAKASGIRPIGWCTELEERLRLMCRDCIDPQLPILEVAGVPMQQDGSGVVVFHVPVSRMAPHRHTATKECYIRRADRTEKMTMREVQDLTLQVERGLATIERRFQQQREQFARTFSAYRGTNKHAFGLRASLVPLTPIYIDRVHGNYAAIPPTHTLFATTAEHQYPLVFVAGARDWRPIVRGTVNRDSNSRPFTVSREVHCDGLIEYSMMHAREGKDSNAPQRFCLPVQWIMAVFGNALCAAEKFRRAAGAPDVEYGLEFEIVSPLDLPIGKYGSTSHWDALGPLPAGTTFPRYSVGSPDEFPSLSQTFERDLWNGAGHDFPNVVTVDFARALRELGIDTGANPPASAEPGPAPA